MSLSVLLKTGAGKFLCWYLGVVAYPSFPACQSFFSSTYWMVFSSTEERKYQGFLQERKADIVERLCWLITITLCCSCKWQFVLFIGTVIITGSAINLYSKTWYCKQSPLIKKEKKTKTKTTPAHVQKEGTAQTEESSQNNCWVLYNDDGEQTKAYTKEPWKWSIIKGLVTDNTIRSALAHTNVMIHVLASVSRREVQNDCTRRLLRDQAQQAQAGGTSVSFWSSSCFFSRDAETGYKQQRAWISSQPLLLR